MDRRQVLIAGLISVLAGSATAQQQNGDADPDLAPTGDEELWSILTAMDALIYIMAVAVVKEPDIVLQARREFQPYSVQLADPKSVDLFNTALKSTDGQGRIESNKATINDAGKEIETLLANVVSEPVSANIVKSFIRASTLLIARSAENKSWWCHVYAFRKVRC
jgi:hypothetical protein